MTTLYKYEGTILKIGDSLAIGENCCCDEEEVIVPCVVQSEGGAVDDPPIFAEDYGWQEAPAIHYTPTTATITAKFKFQDSAPIDEYGYGGCGEGTCPNDQGGTAFCEIILYKETDMMFSLGGKVERMIYHSDWSLISCYNNDLGVFYYFNELGEQITSEFLNAVVSIFCTDDFFDEDNFCLMREAYDSKTLHNLPAGNYTIGFKSTTKFGNGPLDSNPLFHQDMEHSSVVTWNL